MGRWTQYDEDSTRLPEGFERIGYDADTGRYTFRDRDGVIYECEAEYGELVPVSRSSPTNPPKSHPTRSTSLYAPRRPSPSTQTHRRAGTSLEYAGVVGMKKETKPATTFQDFLPPGSIATSPSSSDSSSSSSPGSGSGSLSPRSRFVDAARKTALPKMQGVVHALRRSATSTRGHGMGLGGRKEKGLDGDGYRRDGYGDGVALLRSQSTVSRSTVGSDSVMSGVTLSFGKEKKRF